jgi:hypothetical protein
VNCGVKPYIGIGHSIDPGEEDFDHLPVGIVNIYPDTSIHGERKNLVDNNVVYWDPRLADIVDTLNAHRLNGSTDWVSQMITMNQRTQSMFDDNASYPYLTEGKWYKELPIFTDAKNLLTSQVDTVKPYVLVVMDTAAGAVLPDWRLGSTNLLESDWPIPVDLSYSNATLLSGATGGYPLGDLNWFPAQKAAWLAQRDVECAHIQSALDLGIGTAVNDVNGSMPQAFSLDQNYPNPFNPSTTIRFSIPKAGYATLKVYNILGEEIAILLNGYTTSGTYEVQFNAANLASGVYFYSINAGEFHEVKKMVLMK